MLKPKQKKAAEIMVDEPNLSGFKIAERLGIDPTTMYRWRKNEEFQEYVHSLCKERFKDMEKLAIEKLREHVKNNNWKATEYVLNGLGYKPKEEIGITTKDINLNIISEE